MGIGPAERLTVGRLSLAKLGVRTAPSRNTVLAWVILLPFRFVAQAAAPASAEAGDCGVQIGASRRAEKGLEPVSGSLQTNDVPPPTIEPVPPCRGQYDRPRTGQGGGDGATRRTGAAVMRGLRRGWDLRNLGPDETQRMNSSARL